MTDLRIPQFAPRIVDNAVVQAIQFADIPRALVLHLMRKGEWLHPGIGYAMSPEIARGLAHELLRLADDLDHPGTPDSSEKGSKN